MRLRGDQLVVSPTDLANFLGCPHRTALERAEADGGPRRPKFDDPLLQTLFKRGADHEARYIESLRAEGREIVDIRPISDRAAGIAATMHAMRAGAEVIVQGALESD